MLFKDTYTTSTYLLKGFVYTLQTVSFICASFVFSSAMVSNVGDCVYCCVVSDGQIYYNFVREGLHASENTCACDLEIKIILWSQIISI